MGSTAAASELYERLVAAEVLCVLLGAALALVRSYRTKAPFRDLCWWWGACAVWLMLALDHVLIQGRPIAAPGIAMPGSLSTHLLIIDIPAALRRALEPTLWLPVLLLGIRLDRSVTGRTRRLSRAAWWCAVGLVLLEALLLAPSVRSIASSGHLWWELTVLQMLLTQLLLSGWIALVVTAEPLTGEGSGGLRQMRRLGVALAAVVVSAFLISTSAERPLAGAHYYMWFPDNWKGSFIGEKMAPQILPALGRYSSEDEKVVAAHRSWAHDAGLHFFIYDWWMSRRELKNRVLRAASSFDCSDGMRFALHIETLDLKQKGAPAPEGEPENVVFMTPERARNLTGNLVQLAHDVLKHPCYLRVEGRPVLFLYATRHLIGPVRETFDRIRRELEEREGINPYLIGDEVYYNVLDTGSNGKAFLRGQFDPVWSRLAAFDAITLYNPYDGSHPDAGGSEGVERFLRDTTYLYHRYRAIAATAGIPFIPTVLPGYNDRALRPRADHFVVPRFYGSESFFKHALERLAEPFWRDTGMLIVTSWNEWNEGTQIEPTALSAPTADDESGRGAFSQGETLRGYGSLHLDELRAFIMRRSPLP